jgi:hypothetical protein
MRKPRKRLFPYRASALLPLPTTRAHCLAVALAGLWMGSAGATPALDAHLGRPDALAAQILAGQVQPNAYLRLDHLASSTLLCLMVTNPSPSAVAATDWLLKNGAEVNRDCRLNDLHYGLPLDQVIKAIAFTLSNNEPARGAFLKAQTERLLALGAHTNQGNDTPEGVAREVAYWAKLDRDHQAYIAQWLREEREKSAEFFRTLVGVVGGVAAAYAISKAANGSSVSQQALASSPGGRPAAAGNLPPLLAQAGAGASRVPAPPTPSAGGSNLASPPASTPSASLPPLLAQASAASNRPSQLASAATRPADGWVPQVRTWVWESSRLTPALAQTWCQTETQAMRTRFSKGPDDLLGMEACSCRNDAGSLAASAPGLLQQEFHCSFKYTWRENTRGNAR